MAAKVVDASAIAALVFAEPAQMRVKERLQNAELVAPALIEYEIAAVCVKKLKQYPASRAEILAGHALSRQLALRVVSVNPTETVLLAERTGLTAYDAAYLWLARSLRTELVTLDDRLARAARRELN